MMSLPFLFGFTLLQWRKAIDVMLEKIPGNQQVIWNCHLIPRAEKFLKPHPVQFGNRKGKTSLDALLLK
eukprot:13981428-Ditylum_brightwellii.AAC.1